MAKSPNAGARLPRKAADGRFERVGGHARSLVTEKTVGRKPLPPSADEARLAPAQSILAEAQRSGLLDGEKSEHVSFRAPPALIEAAKRETGVQSTTELGILALATLAQPDPVVAFMRRTRGRLSKYKKLDV